MLIFFSPNKISQLDAYSELFSIQYYADFSDWEKSKATASAFVIDGTDDQYVESVIHKIRRDPLIYATLCFVTTVQPTFDHQLLDGQLPESSILKKTINIFEDLSKSFKNSKAHITARERLIKYLWLRPEFVIQPNKNWRYARYYRYTLLEVLNEDTVDSFAWLRKLAAAKILDPVTLLDRQRECPHCRSPHLSFVDTCPNCSEIDIQLQPSLHCFTCGCVEVQDKFMRAGALICPNCNTHLRHIGSDYDRPLENFRCQSCNYAFNEGEVLARCVTCEKSTKPDELITNEIQKWQLSDRGKVIACHGEVFDLSAGLDHLDFISEELFIHDLDWMMALSRRNKNMVFSLFGIHFSNLNELTVALGHTRVLQTLESFAQQLRQLLRTPDLSTRTAESMIWLLLPNTDKQGLISFHKRMEDSMRQLLQESDEKLMFRFGSISSDQLSDKESAELLLTRLSSELL